MYSTKHLSKQREFLVLLSAYVNQENCTREAVLNYIFEKGWISLSEEERTRRTKDNDKYSWKVSLAYARKRLVTEGCLLGQPWNQWHITRRGIEMLPFKFEEIRAIEHPEVITEKLIEDAGEIISRLILPPAKRKTRRAGVPRHFPLYRQKRKRMRLSSSESDRGLSAINCSGDRIPARCAGSRRSPC